MENFISLDRLSEILGYTSNTLRIKCRAGKIPCYRIDGTYKFLIGEIEEWLESKKQKVVDKKSIKVVKHLRVG
jgi:hypothetical protein